MVRQKRACRGSLTGRALPGLRGILATEYDSFMTKVTELKKSDKKELFIAAGSRAKALDGRGVFKQANWERAAKCTAKAWFTAYFK